jgi:hypothetical protein
MLVGSNDLFQRPLGPISVIFNFSKKNCEVLMKIKEIQAISVTDVLPQPPHPRIF